MTCFCYIIKCNDSSLYTGVTENLEKRFKEYLDKKGARYTAKHKPIEILWYFKYKSRKEALKKEREIKGWRREKKIEFMKNCPSAKGLRA